MALLSTSSSCRFTHHQPVGLTRDKFPSFLQETTLPCHNRTQQVTRAPPQGQGSPYQQQTLGTGSVNIPGFTAPPEISLSFPSHMRSGHTQDMTQLNNRSASGDNMKERKKSNRKSKSTYKHVPHREKPPHVVARRNARERRRVQVSGFIKMILISFIFFSPKIFLCE